MSQKQPGPRQWLFKSDADSFAWNDLWAEKHRRTFWDGVRNYQARNLLRDQIQDGDGVLFYHSSVEPMAIVGICKVTRAGYPDPSAFVEGHMYFDPDSDPAHPTWYCVEIEAVRAIDPPLTRGMLAAEPELKNMELLRRGSRLSVQPVSDAEWECVLRLADREAQASDQGARGAKAKPNDPSARGAKANDESARGAKAKPNDPSAREAKVKANYESARGAKAKPNDKSVRGAEPSGEGSRGAEASSAPKHGAGTSSRPKRGGTKVPNPQPPGERPPGARRRDAPRADPSHRR